MTRSASVPRVSRPTPLAEARQVLGLSQADLARRAGLSRQALGSIERGQAMPGVDLALRLASLVGSDVDTLFGSHTEVRSPRRGADSNGFGPDLRLAGPLPGLADGRPVRVVWARIDAVLVLRAALPDRPADALVERASPSGGPRPLLADTADGDRLAVTLHPLPGAGRPDRALWVGGCDPAAAVLGATLEEESPGIRVSMFPMGSVAALSAFAERTVHVAGLHLYDPGTGTYNRVGMAATARTLGQDLVSLSYATWEEGLATRHVGTPSLNDPGLRWAVRPPGTEARALWTRVMADLGRPVPSPDHLVVGRTHVDVAHLLAEHGADLGITLASLAADLGLTFRPLSREPYELLVRRDDSAARNALARALESSTLRRQVSCLTGYDTGAMGQATCIRPGLEAGIAHAT